MYIKNILIKIYLTPEKKWSQHVDIEQSSCYNLKLYISRVMYLTTVIKWLYILNSIYQYINP